MAEADWRSAPRPLPRAAKKTILLIENEPEGLIDISEYLNTLGYGVVALPDGPTALSTLKELHVDLVIASHQAAGMETFELLQEIKTAAPSIPTIIVSAYGTIESYLKALSLGVFEFVNKPVKPKDMTRIVKAALEAGPGPQQAYPSA